MIQQLVTRIDLFGEQAGQQPAHHRIDTGMQQRYCNLVLAPDEFLVACLPQPPQIRLHEPLIHASSEKTGTHGPLGGRERPRRVNTARLARASKA